MVLKNEAADEASDANCQSPAVMPSALFGLADQVSSIVDVRLEPASLETMSSRDERVEGGSEDKSEVLTMLLMNSGKVTFHSSGVVCRDYVREFTHIISWSAVVRLP